MLVSWRLAVRVPSSVLLVSWRLPSQVPYACLPAHRLPCQVPSSVASLAELALALAWVPLVSIVAVLALLLPLALSFGHPLLLRLRLR